MVTSRLCLPARRSNYPTQFSDRQIGRIPNVTMRAKVALAEVYLAIAVGVRFGCAPVDQDTASARRFDKASPHASELGPLHPRRQEMKPCRHQAVWPVAVRWHAPKGYVIDIVLRVTDEMLALSKKGENVSSRNVTKPFGSALCCAPGARRCWMFSAIKE